MLQLCFAGLGNRGYLALLGLAVFLGYAGVANATLWQVGDETSYTQSSWGGDPVGSGPPLFLIPADGGAALLVAQFDTLYGPAGGVVVGSGSGFVMVFTDTASVLAYQPSIGPFAPLNSSVVNPISTASGSFGGEVLGLEFNVHFSDAGFLPAASGIPFGDLVLAGLASLPQIDGLTVRQFLGDLNTLLSGGSSIFSIADLGTTVGNVNGSFLDGQPSQFAQDHLVAPAQT